MQVILWTDNATLQLQKNNNITFEEGVKTKNITEEIPHMLNYDIIARLKNIGAITDILKYEVRICIFICIYLIKRTNYTAQQCMLKEKWFYCFMIGRHCDNWLIPIFQITYKFGGIYLDTDSHR